jgi:hypothetical protein
MNKLEQINKSITEIREMLGEDCTPISELPEKVKDVVEHVARGYFTTAFVFSKESNPTKPSGGKLNVVTGLVEGISAV